MAEAGCGGTEIRGVAAGCGGAEIARVEAGCGGAEIAGVEAGPANCALTESPDLFALLWRPMVGMQSFPATPESGVAADSRYAGVSRHFDRRCASAGLDAI